jgi:hypothetical protein
MKRILIGLAVVVTAAACNPNTGQGGAVDDGIKTIDSNGAFDESAPASNGSPGVDSARGDDRVDIQSRDSANIGR